MKQSSVDRFAERRAELIDDPDSVHAQRFIRDCWEAIDSQSSDDTKPNDLRFYRHLAESRIDYRGGFWEAGCHPGEVAILSVAKSLGTLSRLWLSLVKCISDPDRESTPPSIAARALVTAARLGVCVLSVYDDDAILPVVRALLNADESGITFDVSLAIEDVPEGAVLIEPITKMDPKEVRVVAWLLEH